MKDFAKSGFLITFEKRKNNNKNETVEDFCRDVSLLWNVVMTFIGSQTHNIILRVQNIC